MSALDPEERAPRFSPTLLLALGITPVVLIAVLLIALAWPREEQGRAPEAERILAAQAGLPFQVLIPAFLPADVDRANVRIDVKRAGQDASPVVELEYRGRTSVVLIREWRIERPELETLVGALPIDTRWGKGFLRTGAQGEFTSVWIDAGSVRVAVHSPARNTLTTEQLLSVVETLGPAANRQVSSSYEDKPVIREAVAPTPVAVPQNAQGVQDLVLVIAPSGYSPARFAVQKGIPVHLVFRQLGRVGCGSTLIFPASPAVPATLTLNSPQDKAVLDFVPSQAGEYEFHCIDSMYRGIMVVKDALSQSNLIQGDYP